MNMDFKKEGSLLQLNGLIKYRYIGIKTLDLTGYLYIMGGNKGGLL